MPATLNILAEDTVNIDDKDFIVDSSPSTVATSASSTDGTNEISTDLPARADTVRTANDALLQPISSLPLLLLWPLLRSVGLTLLPVVIVARYFSIPESYGVPHLFAASVTLHRRLLPLLLYPQQPDLCFIDKTEHPFLYFLNMNEQPLAPFWTLCLQHQAAATLLTAPKSDPNADTTAASPRTNRCLSCPLPLPHSACGELVSYERQTNLMIEGGASKSLRSHSRSLLPPGLSDPDNSSS
ncbi:hypothetical protein BHM03_00012088 [Ensete ventricosum]|nr:hypothetical protein BHM03_00012088 [Ensete ventricosum]